MKALYVDTSALICQMVDQGAGRTFAEAFKTADFLCSAALIEAGLLAFLTREGLATELGKQACRNLSLLLPDRPLAAELSRVFSLGYCKGADAWHLACALYIDPTAAELSFASADHKQAALARALGFTVLTFEAETVS